MKKTHAICLSCGHPKYSYLSECENCGFFPKSIKEKAMSLMLSTDFEVQTEEYGNENISMSWEELVEIGKSIESGRKFDYPQEQLNLAIRQIKFLETLTPRKVLWATFLWLLPLLIAIAVLLYLALHY